MKTPTINQINGRVISNPTIQYYQYLSQDYIKYSDEWRHRYFEFFLSGRQYNITPLGNFIYGAAERDFKRIIQTDTRGLYSYDNKYFAIEFCNKRIEFQLSLRIDFRGVYLRCDTNFKAIEQFMGNSFAPIKVRSNSTLAEFDLQEYFIKKILPKYLYPEGIFRNIQIIENCSKKEALEYYRKYLSINATHKYEEERIDSYTAITKRLKKKLNIVACGFISEAKLLRVLKTTKTQPVTTELHPEPSFWELSDLYSQTYDEDGHEEQFINHEFEERYSKHSIFA